MPVTIRWMKNAQAVLIPTPFLLQLGPGDTADRQVKDGAQWTW